MAEAKQSAFEGWAVVELMGHQMEIGFVTTEAYGQAVMFRVDTPDLPEREFELISPEYIRGDWVPAGSKVKRPAVPPCTRLVAPGSLYAINPCTEEAARTALERVSPRPLILVEVAPGKALAAASTDADGDLDEDDLAYSTDDTDRVNP
jgi:hypothetical protein